jgi:hypothetical protein
LKLSPEMIDRIANHIADFSLAGLRSLARGKKATLNQAVAVS